jgi:ribosomal protein L22
MADEKQDPKQNNEAEAKPTRRRAAAAAKDTEAEAKPKRRRASAKAKPQETAESTEKAAEKAAEEAGPKPRRRTTRAKEDESPKAKPKARAKPKAQAKADGEEGEAAKEAASKPPARRRAAAPAAERKAERRPPVRPVVTARAKYVRSSARKARLVIDHVRGKPIDEARALLRHSPRGVARDLERLLESAIANAENNHDLIGDDLYVKEIYADEGPTLKRFRPRAMGRATRIRKRTSHLTIALTPRGNGAGGAKEGRR